ncbi:MAG: hypothetical protein U1F68_00610 [Gammaproteobacteria bacterium]
MEENPTQSSPSLCCFAVALPPLPPGFQGQAPYRHRVNTSNGTPTVGLKIQLRLEYDNAVIKTAPGELGSEFGPDKQPFKDVTLNITVNGAGPKGSISGLAALFQPIRQNSGGKVNIVELPFAEHHKHQDDE